MIYNENYKIKQSAYHIHKKHIINYFRAISSYISSGTI